MMFAIFKLFGGIFCFICNVCLAVYSDNIADVVKDFVAVQIISQVDDLMVGTVTADDSVDSMRLFVSNERLKRSDMEIWECFIGGKATGRSGEAEEEARVSGEYKQPLSLTRKVALVMNLVFYRINSIIYHIFYFYFAPFIVSIIVIYAGSDHGRPAAEVDANAAS